MALHPLHTSIGTVHHAQPIALSPLLLFFLALSRHVVRPAHPLPVLLLPPAALLLPVVAHLLDPLAGVHPFGRLHGGDKVVVQDGRAGVTRGAAGEVGLGREGGKEEDSYSKCGCFMLSFYLSVWVSVCLSVCLSVSVDSPALGKVPQASSGCPASSSCAPLRGSPPPPRPGSTPDRRPAGP